MSKTPIMVLLLRVVFTYEKAGQQIENVYKRIGGVVGAYLTFDFVQGLSRDIVTVTGEFQKYAAVLENSLGSQQKAADSMEMLKTFAATTPFQLDELTGAYVKLVNQGFKPSEVQMTKLGDLASSTGKGFDQLAEAILDAQTGEFERLKEFGILASKQGDHVTFSFKGVQTQVDFTNQSIRDYIVSLGSMEGVMGSNAKIAETMATEVSNLQDKLTGVLADIGDKNKDEIGGILTFAGKAIDHYQDLIDVMKVLVATYGSYKAVLLITTALQNAGGVIANVRAWMQLAATIRSAKDAQIAFNLATSANPFGAIAAAIALVTSTLVLFANTAAAAERATSKLEDVNKNASEGAKDEKNKIDALVLTIRNETTTREQKNEAIKKLNDIMPDNLGYITEEAVKTGKATEAIDTYIRSVERQIKIDGIKEEIRQSQQRSMSAGKDVGLWSTVWNTVKSAGNANAGKAMAIADIVGSEGEYQKVLMKDLKRLTEESVVAENKFAKSKARTVSVIDDEIKEMKKASDESSLSRKAYEEYNVKIAKLEKERDAIAGHKQGRGSSGKDKKDGEAYRELLSKLYSDINKDRLSIMQDGAEKEMQAIKNEYADKIKGIEKQERALLEAYNKSKGLKKGDKGYLSQLPAEASSAIAELKRLAETVRNSKELKMLLGDSNELVMDNSLESLLAATETYEQKRLNIVGKAMKDIADLENAGAKENAAVRRKRMNKSLEELKQSHQEEIKQYSYLFENIERLGAAELQSRIHRLQQDLKGTSHTAEEKLAIEKALAEAEDALINKSPLRAIGSIDERIKNNRKLLEQEKKALEQAKASSSATKEELDLISGRIDKLNAKLLDDTSKKAESISKHFEGVREKLEKITGKNYEWVSGVGKVVNLTVGLKEKLEKLNDPNEKLGDKITTVGDSFSQIGNAVESFNAQLGESISLAGNLASSIGQIASGNYVGGIISGVSSLVTYFASADARAQKEHEAQIRREAELQQIRINALNSILELQKKIAEESLGADKLDNYNKLIKKTQSTLADATQQAHEAYITIKGLTGKIDLERAKQMAVAKGGAFNPIASVYGQWALPILQSLQKFKTIDLSGSLSKTEEQFKEARDAVMEYHEAIEKGGKFIAPQNIDQLNAIAEQYEEKLNSLNELLNKQRELLTGNTYSSIVDGIASAFDDGIVSAEEFTSKFGELMKKQVLNALKTKFLEERMEKFYADFALASESDGKLTEGEIGGLAKQYKGIMEDGQKKLDELNSVMKNAGIDIFEAAASGAKENSAIGIVKNLSEQTGTEIVGNLTGMRYDIREQHMTIREHLATMNESVSIQRAIEANTAATVTNLGVVIGQLAGISSQIGGNQSSGRETGK